MRWILGNPVVGATLVGSRTLAEMTEYLGAFGWKISRPDMVEIDD